MPGHLYLTDAHLAVAETTRAFAEKEIRPIAAELDEAAGYPEALYRKMAGLGMAGVTVPEALGGMGADVLTYAVVMEELSRGYSAVADHFGLVELIATLLAQYGTPAQQDRYLRPLLKAERRCAYALTEAEAGSDLAGLKTTAAKQADGSWRLDGGKLWIHNAPVADFACVLTRTDKAAGHRGMSIFIVDRDLPGYSIGRHEKKMGQRASQVGALHFDNIRLGADSMLGPQGRGFHIMMSVLDKGRVGIGALALGILQAALDASIAYAKQRRQFGKPIAAFQAVQWMVADMAKDAHAARLMIHAAAAKMDAHAQGAGERASLECSMAKCFAADAAMTHTVNAVQVHGGSGYIKGIEVERLMRDAKITQIYEGTNQIQRMIMARHLLGEAAQG
ncbi:MAG: acyl-CoA dehydrogenase family protein [Alphaproteobacteria bacterium]|nr:acyl-CoA dehydrogenase family protein [Alphaproteobacteria bacterium]